MCKKIPDAIPGLFRSKTGGDLLSHPGFEPAVSAKRDGPAFCCSHNTDIPDPALPAASRAAGDPDLNLCRELFSSVFFGNFLCKVDGILSAVLAVPNARA